MRLSCSYVGSTVNSTVIRSRIGPAKKKEANPKGILFATMTPNATTIAAMEAADRGDVEETSLVELARLWEGACAKSVQTAQFKKDLNRVASCNS